MKTFSIVEILISVLLACSGWAQHSTYAGLETRELKTLSEEQIEGYLHGQGMGMALPAELNSYPGPKHVLELSDSLKISDEQEKQIQAIFDEMHEEAVKLGKSIVEREDRLDQLFESREITDNSLASLISEISDLRGKLRFTHLNAHIKTVAVLDSAQIEKYNRLRGYGSNMMHHHNKK